MSHLHLGRGSIVRLRHGVPRCLAHHPMLAQQRSKCAHIVRAAVVEEATQMQSGVEYSCALAFRLPLVSLLAGSRECIRLRL